MKKLIVVVVFAGLSVLSARAQGTYSSEGEIVDKMKAIVGAYLDQDWDAYRSFFVDTVGFFPSSTEKISLDERVEQHVAGLSLFDSYDFVNPIYGNIENSGQSWGLLWGTWTGTVKGSGEIVKVPVHVAVLFVDGKGVAEYGFWDNAPFMAVAEAMSN